VLVDNFNVAMLKIKIKIKIIEKNHINIFSSKNTLHDNNKTHLIPK
jgi:hypothetical protein